MRLTAFGGLAIRAEAGETTPARDLSVSRRALALLVLVAAAKGGISRDKVLALLWPESDEEHGRNALRQTLHTLRRELRAPELLQGTDVLRLDPATIGSDLRDFEAARAAGRVEEAVGLYAGPFLDGFHVGGAPEFERWVEETRAAYKREFAGLLETLARESGRAGDPSSAVKWWRKLAAEDPLDSAVALNLMEALVAAGDRAGALRHGQVHERLMREELDSGPDPAVRGLLERLRGASASEATAAPPTGSGEARQRHRDAPAAPPPHGASFIARLTQELQGRYIVQEELERSRGGVVRLLRARDVRHERAVVLKVLNPALASGVDVDRFLREIKLTARLRHPSIVPLLDSGEVEGLPWFAMPELGGTSLRERLTTDATMPLDQTLRVAEELAGALDHAHRHGVVHRDVCPENILLTEGHALLVNLGVARALDLAATPKLTETGILVGSPAYMSPEQATGNSPVEGRSDQYSLACVLFELLTGEPLFSGPTAQAIMAKRAAFSPRQLEQVTGLSGAARAALARSLSSDPARRFPTTAELATALAEPSGRPARSSRRWLGWFGTR